MTTLFGVVKFPDVPVLRRSGDRLPVRRSRETTPSRAAAVQLSSTAIRSPSNQTGEKYVNVLLKEAGLRLIDVGISALREQVGDKIFSKFCETELAEIEKFEIYFLNR